MALIPFTSNFSDMTCYNYNYPFDTLYQNDHIDPIDEAVRSGNFQEVSDLLNAGANPNVLHLARTKEIATLLLNNGAQVDFMDWNSSTPLFSAIKNGCTDVVKVLLENNASLYARTGLGESILHCIIHNYHGNLEIFKLLPKHDIICLNKMYSAVHLAFKLQKFDLLEEMVKKGASLNVRNNIGLTVLHEALRETTCNLITVTRLLKLGADPNIEYCVSDSKVYPIQMAIKNGSISILAELLKYGASVKPEKTYNPLIKALEYSHTNSDDIVQLLLNYGAKAGPYDPKSLSALEIQISPVMFALCKHSHKLPNSLKLLVKYSSLQYFNHLENKTEIEIQELLNNASNYGIDCLRECDQMQRITLHKNHTLYSYLRDFHINNLRTYIESYDENNTVLNFSKECPIYRDLIIKLLNRKHLIHAIMKNKNVSNFKKMTDDSIYYIANYLSHNDLCNILIAFI